MPSLYLYLLKNKVKIHKYMMILRWIPGYPLQTQRMEKTEFGQTVR